MSDYIATYAELLDYVAELRRESWFAIDTEFLREKTYYPKLCLIQIGTAERQVCIDPLAIADLSPLLEVLYDDSIVKVLHAAHQDLEIFLNLGGQLPSPIFDTQIAAAVLGLGEQMGYARLVESRLGVNLAKTQSRTDWTRRPLKPAQIDYAVDDVKYLAQIYPAMHEELTQLSRLEWLTTDFNYLTSPETYAINAENRWEKVRGLQVLKRQHLSVLRALAAWREVYAEQKNLPRKWILSDEILIDLSRQMPQSLDALRDIRGFDKDRLKRHQGVILDLIKQGASQHESEWPELLRKKKPSTRQNFLIDLLMLVISIKAKEYNISPGMIATRKQVADMVQSGRHVLANDWRGELMNDVLSQVLRGELNVSVDGQLVVLSATS